MIIHAFAARASAIAPPIAPKARTKSTRRVIGNARSNRRVPPARGFTHAVARGGVRTHVIPRVSSASGQFDPGMCDVSLPGPASPLFAMDISTPTVLTSDLKSVMDPAMCRLAPKKTHIICTLGPSSRSVEDLENLLLAGMSVARFNFSHGTHEYHLETLTNLRAACESVGKICAVLLDTKGPEIRTGALVDGESVRLRRGSLIELTTDYAVLGTSERVAISYQHLARDVNQGDTILMSDGNVMMEVLETDVEKGTVRCECLNDATLGERKNCNLPGVTVDLPTMTEKDLHDIIGFGVVNDVDFIAASFVRKASDVTKIREVLKDAGGETIKIISKVENYEGLCNYDAILNASDGIMVARGDLGMEIPLERIFWVQKMMIRKANLAGKPVITATQMLDSMIAAPRPTRAEATDVANAVLDGTDCVMLSGETAAGAYPREAVEIMAGICEEAEQCVDNYALSKSLLNVILDGSSGAPLSTIEALASSTVMTAAKTKAACIVVLAANGEAARMIAKYRPAVPIVVGVVPRSERKSIGFSEVNIRGRQVARQLMLTRGLIPTVLNPPEDHEDAFASSNLNSESEAPQAAKRCVIAAVRFARRQMLCRPGDKVVAMYNVERRCAVIRVIEVTEEMMEESHMSFDEGEPAVMAAGAVPVE